MLPRWGYIISVTVVMLGACSVYDGSLLASNAVVLGGAGGNAGSALGDDAGLSSAAARPSDVGAGGLTGGESHAGGTWGGGGGTSGGGAAGATGGSAGAVSLELESIDTMEDGDAALEHVGMRNGDWFAGHDATTTGTQFPGSPFTMSALDNTDPRKSMSKYAAMTKGSGYTDWGADLGFNLLLANAVTETHPTYDASAYCGVRFYARVGAGASTAIVVRVPDKNSLPDGGVCGGSGMPCYVSFQASYTLTTAWAEYDVLFSQLRNNGWATGFAQNAIFSVEFGLPPSSPFELWVDDVSFLKKPASGVCPASNP